MSMSTTPPAPPAIARQSHFDVLGLPRRFHIDARVLEERYHAAAREHHPDRHYRDESARRVSSALRTAALTEAYRVLRDPIRRGEHLLELEGIRLGDERRTVGGPAGQGGHKVDPSFLMEILELREGLAEARAEGDEARVDALGVEVRDRHRAALDALDEAWRRYDDGAREVLGDIAGGMIALRYYRRFLDELEAHEEARLDGAT